MVRKSKRTYNIELRPYCNHGDDSLKFISWYGRKYCRRFKGNNNCGCGGNSRHNKKLGHHGHYMRYSYRLLRRAKMAERGITPARR